VLIFFLLISENLGLFLTRPLKDIYNSGISVVVAWAGFLVELPRITNVVVAHTSLLVLVYIVIFVGTGVNFPTLMRRLLHYGDCYTLLSGYLKRLWRYLEILR